MVEQKKNPTAPAGKPAKKAPAPAAPKLGRYMKRFVDGARGELRFTALEKKDGTAESYAIHVVRGEDGKKIKEQSRGRGASQKHANFEDSKKAVDASVDFAVKQGWTAVVPKTGGRKDAFDLTALPAPTKK
jgi:hypothetical protein